MTFHSSLATGCIPEGYISVPVPATVRLTHMGGGAERKQKTLMEFGGSEAESPPPEVSPKAVREEFRLVLTI